MKRYLLITLSLALSMAFLPTPARSVERSGEVIREIMNAIDNEMTSMEKQGEVLSKSRKSLLKALDKDFNYFKAEVNPVKRQLLAANLQVTMAKLNAQESKEVQIYLNTLHGLIPKIGRLKEEITSGGGVFVAGATFNQYRRKMGRFMTQAVGILDGLKQGATGVVRQEIVGLEALLVSSYITLTPGMSQAQSSARQLTEVQADLENAFLQLVNIEKLLKQERRELQINSELVMARLVLQRLQEGPLSNGQFFSKPRAIKDALKKRRQISQEVRLETSDRIRRGEY
jgi:cysteinyl-tRNA synthetase